MAQLTALWGTGGQGKRGIATNQVERQREECVSGILVSGFAGSPSIGGEVRQGRDGRTKQTSPWGADTTGNTSEEHDNTLT